MKLYLLSCQSIRSHDQRILPLLPAQRRLAYARTHSDLTLGAGLLLASVLHVHRDEDLVFGPQGKPFLAGNRPEFSLSHSGAHVLLGVSDAPLGVDLERMDRRINESVQRRICLPQEQGLDPMTVFTRKECAMKLTGLGFSLPLQEIDTTRDFIWQNEPYRFFTTEREGYRLSVLTAEEAFPEIQLLAPEDLL